MMGIRSGIIYSGHEKGPIRQAEKGKSIKINTVSIKRLETIFIYLI